MCCSLVLDSVTSSGSGLRLWALLEMMIAVAQQQSRHKPRSLTSCSQLVWQLASSVHSGPRAQPRIRPTCRGCCSGRLSGRRAARVTGSRRARRYSTSPQVSTDGTGGSLREARSAAAIGCRTGAGSLFEFIKRIIGGKTQ